MRAALRFCWNAAIGVGCAILIVVGVPLLAAAALGLLLVCAALVVVAGLAAACWELGPLLLWLMVMHWLGWI